MNVCGGSIYSEDVIITAAHCCDHFRSWYLTDFEIIGGELDLSKESGTEQKHSIKGYKKHPGYVHLESRGKFIRLESDVCLLYLDTPFDLTQPDISTIAIAHEDPSQSTECLISGWGKTIVSICRLHNNFQIVFKFIFGIPIFHSYC